MPSNRTQTAAAPRAREGVRCGTCHGDGEIVGCIDDICHGKGRCIHDGNDTCPSCRGTGVVPRGR